MSAELPRSMRVVRWHGRGDVRVERAPVPRPGPDEALVRVLHTGLCGSDLEEYLDGPVVVAGPVVLGHEIVGVVAAAARDGSGPVPGTVVVVDVVTGCGHCFHCVHHEEGRCARLRVTGLHVDGGLADYVAARANRLVRVPDGLDPVHAGLAEPTAVAVRAVRTLGAVADSAVLVVGGGTVGLLTAQVLRHAGASAVVVLEPDPWRREVAHRLGLRTAWAADEGGRAELLGRLFLGRGLDAVVECSGADGAAREAIRAVRAGGTVVLLSITPTDQAVDLTDAVLGEKTIVGSAAHMWDDDVEPAVALLASGAVQVAPLVTHRLPLRDGPRAFALLADRSAHVVKLLVDVHGTGPDDEEEHPA